MRHSIVAGAASLIGLEALSLVGSAGDDIVRSSPQPGAGARRAAERLAAKLKANAAFYAHLPEKPDSRQVQRHRPSIYWTDPKSGVRIVRRERF